MLGLLNLLLLSSYLFTQVLGVALIEKFNADLKAEFLKAHNDIRSQVSNPTASNMQTMSWDNDLALVAEANVKTCVMKHTPKEDRKTSAFELIGENLYDHWGGNNSLVNIGPRALAAWYSEKKDYHFKNRSCTGKMCGHYTQVIWATSYKVGCAIAICDGGAKEELNGILVCCNYALAGNQIGPDGPHSPYKVGEPCTECYEGQSCNNKLCRTPDGVTPPPELVPVVGVQTLSEDLKDDLLKEHNDRRSEVSDPEATDMQMLSWDDELAKVAEANVKGCVLKHTSMENARTSQFYPVGENLYSYRGTDKSLDGIANRMVTKWYNERNYYHYSTRTCTQGKMCTHYTQLVWAHTIKVGCAIAICDGKEGKQINGILACCNYGPHGNDFDETGVLSPYKAGEPCIGCNEGQRCKNKLCYSATVDTDPPAVETVVESSTESIATSKTTKPAGSRTITKTTKPTTKTAANSVGVTSKTTTSTQSSATAKSTTNSSVKTTERAQIVTTPKTAVTTQSSTTAKSTKATAKTTERTQGITTPKTAVPTQSSTTANSTTKASVKTTERAQIVTTPKTAVTTQSSTTAKSTKATAKTTERTQGITTPKTAVPTQSSTTAKSTTKASVKTTERAQIDTTPKTAVTTQSNTTAKSTKATAKTTERTQGITTSKTAVPTQSSTTAKTTVRSQGITAKTTESAQSSTTTKMPTPSAKETPQPTQVHEIANTPETTNNINATGSTPILTTSGEQGVHNFPLFLIAAINCITTWYFATQK